jgi:hypothetical protein
VLLPPALVPQTLKLMRMHTMASTNGLLPMQLVHMDMDFLPLAMAAGQ